MSERRRMLLAIVNQFKLFPYSYTYLYHSLVPQTISGKNVRNKAKLTKIYGNSEVVNQWFNPNQSANQNGITLTNNNDGSITLSGIATANAYLKFQGLIDAKAGDVCLFFSNHKDITGVAVGLDGLNTYWNNLSGEIKTISNSQQCFPSVRVLSGTDLSTPITIYPQMVKLTQAYPFDTTTTLTDNRVKNILAQGYIPYNTGEIKDMVIGEFSSNDSNNQPLGTLLLPAPYQASGIGTSKDSWEITNTSHIFTRNNFWVDLGLQNWTYEIVSSGDNYYTDVIPNSKTTSSVLCEKYGSNTNVSPDTLRNNAWISASCRINITADGYSGNVNNFKTAMSGVILKYQLATPQTITIPRKHLAVLKFSDLSNWAYDSTRKFFATQISNIKVPTSQSELGNYYTSDFLNGTTNAIQGDTTKDMYFFITPSGYIRIRDLSCSTTNDFLAKHGNDVLFYETDTEVADITDTFDIEAGGTITSDSDVLPDVNFSMKCK